MTVSEGAVAGGVVNEMVSRAGELGSKVGRWQAAASLSSNIIIPIHR